MTKKETNHSEGGRVERNKSGRLPRSRSKSGRLHPEEMLAHSVTEAAFRIARETGASNVLIHLRSVPETVREQALANREELLLIVRSTEEAEAATEYTQRVVQIPQIALSRMGQMKVAILIALAKGFVEANETVIALAGSGERDALDSLVVMDIGRELELFSLAHDNDTLPDDVQPEVFERALYLASRLATEGREGKRIGTIFVLGDVERVVKLTTQLIINPFKGYARKDCNLIDPRLEETVKGFAAIDGAFVVDGDGTILSAGTLLPTSLSEEGSPGAGLGTRHAAARCISATTEAIAIAISQSTGTIRIYRAGREVMAIEETGGR